MVSGTLLVSRRAVSPQSFFHDLWLIARSEATTSAKLQGNGRFLRVADEQGDGSSAEDLHSRRSRS